MSVTRLTCSSCDARLKVSAEPGKAIKCPRCKKPIRVPELDAEVDFEDADEPEEAPAPKKRPASAGARKPSRPRDDEDDDPDEKPAPKKKRDAITDEEPPRKRAALTSKAGKSAPARSREEDPDEDEDEDRPRKRGKAGRKQKKGSPVLLWVGLGGGLLLVAGVVLAVVLIMMGRKEPAQTSSPPPKTQEPPKPKGYQSPQEVFDAKMAALKRKDAKGVVACYTAQGRREQASELAFLFVFNRNLYPADTQEGAALAPLSAQLDKHGLTREATKRHVSPNNLPRDKQDLRKQGEKLLSTVKDVDALLVDLLDALFQLDRDGAVTGQDLVLKNVQINADRATGKATAAKPRAVKDFGIAFPIQPEESPEFEKVDGGWLISRDDR